MLEGAPLFKGEARTEARTEAGTVLEGAPLLAQEIMLSDRRAAMQASRKVFFMLFPL